MKRLTHEESCKILVRKMRYVSINEETKETIIPPAKEKYMRTKWFVRDLLKDFGYKFLLQQELDLFTVKK